MRSEAGLLVVVTLLAACSGGSSETAAEQAAAAFPPQPQGVPFPTEDWREGAWPSGVDPAEIDGAVDAAFAAGGRARVRAVVIVHGGELVYERYSPNREDGPYRQMRGHSLAKSFTSALVGVLVREGRLDVDAPAPVRAWRGDDDPRRSVTLDHLLRMSSGLEWDEGRYPDNADLTAMIGSDDAGAYAARKKLARKPGSGFQYNTGNTILVDRIMADEVGSGAEFRTFMDDALLGKIGITLDTEFDAAGTWLGGWTADTTARDFAKLGLLYLRDGVWDGERILPEGWVEYSRRPSRANPEYGAGWWLDLERPGVFYAVGRAGQVITVDPAHDLTFVLLATDGRPSLGLTEAILNTFTAVD
jgi:CubicO group peptidase (beta-lactamase class C family)